MFYLLLLGSNKVPLIKRYFIFLFLFSLSQSSFGQKASSIPLPEALLEVAAQHKISLVFNPKKVSNIKVELPPVDWSLSKKIELLLQKTKLQFEIKEDQIFLYQKHQIFGYIEDATTGDRLIGATIYLPQIETYDVTNEYGYFSLSTIEDSIEIEVSYLGYSDLTKTIFEQAMDKPTIFSLAPDNQIEEIVISDALTNTDDRRFIELNKGSDILLLQNQASSAVGGEPDIFQAMIRQSGVSSGADGIGGIHVRGGKNDQNQILYDGVRLYNSAHAFGVYSIVNNSIIDRANLHKTGANGSISGRLSSVMDIRIKDPDLRNYKASIQTSTLATQALVNIPIWKDRIGIQGSARRTHIDPIIKSLSRASKLKDEDLGESNFKFNDFNFKLYGKVNNRQRLYLSIYGSNDRHDDQFEYTTKEFGQVNSTYDVNSSLDWSNKLATIRYNVLLGRKSFANIQLSTYTYRYDNKYVENQGEFLLSNDPYYDRFLIDFSSGIQSHEFRLDVQSHLGQHEFKYGIIGSQKEYQAGTLYIEEFPDDLDQSVPIPTTFPLEKISFGDYAAIDFTTYISDKVRINDDLLIDGGLYVNYYKGEDINGEEFFDDYLSIFGYFKSIFLLSDRLSLGASIGTYVQNEHLLTTGDNGYPSDIWLPSTYFTPPERSYQGEIFTSYSNKGHALKSSLYYKKQQGLVIFDTIAVLPSVTILNFEDWETQTILADTESIGFELEYSYSLEDKFNFRGMYSFGFSNYIFEDDFGKYGLPFEYSIPHTVSLGFNAQLTKRIRFMADWLFSSGKPYTLYSTNRIYSPLDRDSDIDVNIESGFNEFRLPNTHKLSIAFSTYWYWGKLRSDLNLGIQNVYNRRNVLYRYQYFDSEIRDQHGFPLIPMLRWRVSL